LTTVFCCQPDNDLYRVLEHTGHDAPRYASLQEALQAAPRGAGVLALADDYPRPSLALDKELLRLAEARGLRLYLEYPASLPGVALGEPRPTRWERVVVSSDFFCPALERHTILAQHGCWFLPVETDPPLCEGHLSPGERQDVALAVARVAGYDRALYGLPAEAEPILFALPGSPVLIATSKLSQFVRGRYGPQRAWKAIWERLLAWVDGSDHVPACTWTPTVRVHAGPGTPLDRDAEQDALRRSVRWFREQVVYRIDRKVGAMEGFEATIDYQGRQMRRPWVRGDCTAETGMVFACDWALTGNPESRHLATQILDTVWSAPDFVQDDPHSPAYGLNNWYERGPVFYGDDNARVIAATLVARQLLGDERWDERVLRCLLANLRTTGRLGFRRNRIDLHQFYEQDRGWEFYQQEEVISYAPHYQAYLWAAYLLGYALTRYDGFVDKTKTAMRMTMEAYPNWRWTNGFTQELARMVLPLAFLVQVEDTHEHRGWLERISAALLAQMQVSPQACGAIREQLGPRANGQYAPPASNEAYGTSEAPLIQANGDPACDLLYTTNYAFLGLHEAVAATGDDRLAEAEDRLADFLLRVQVRSEAHPYLDGAWMRSFDYERWEYWGSSSDVGWGAWSVESGWTNTWIAAVLAMRQGRWSLFELATARGMEDKVSALLGEMLRER
jgi:hypothetical protein